MPNFNDTHPELKDDEVWLKNATQNRFELMEWKTKRAGTTAYYSDGSIIHSPGHFPVFVKKTEYQEREESS